MTKDQPEIKILIQPTNRMRFRYGSEKGSHGALTGSQDKKSFPTVKLENYIIEEKPVFIRASLYTNDREPKLHVHRFKGPYCEEGMCIVEVDKESMTAVFQNLSIEFIGKKEVTKILYERKLRLSNISSNQYASTGSCDILEISKKEANKMNLNVVRICFEAVVQDPHTRTWHSLGEKVFSEPIYNQKATETGELKIVRMDKCSGSCAGGDEIFLLCDKVNKKDIKVQFYEEKNGKIIWENWGLFTEVDVHYQVAIVFQTPPYHHDISESVDVLIRLYRMSDQETSEPKKFSYLPKEQDKEGIETKRRKVAYSSRPTEGFSGYKTSPSSPYSTSSLSSGEFGSQKKSESGGMDEIISPELSEEISNCLLGNVDFDSFAFDSLMNTLSDPVLASTSIIFQPNTSVEDMKMDSRHLSPGSLLSDSVREQAHLSDTMAKLSITKSSSSHVTVTDHPAADEHELTIKHEGDRLNSYDQSVIDIEKEILGKLHLLIEVCVYKFGYRILTELQKQTNQGKGLAMFYALQSLLLERNKDGDNALHLALIHESENEKFLFKLIEVMKSAPGDAINNYNNAHQTALHLAVMCKKPSLALCLLSAGARQNLKDKNGDTAVHIAASLGETECLNILLSSKYSNKTTKLNDLNYSGKAPLHLAVEKDDRAAVELLCAPGADINIADGKSGKTPLHYAARSSLAIVSILLKQDKVEVNLQDYGGNTPLHLACAQGAEEIVLQLIQNNADPLIKNHSQDGNELHSDAEETILEKGKTAFDYAENNKKILAILNGKYDERSLSNLDAFTSENSCIQTERNDRTLTTKSEQKQDFKATPKPCMKTTEEKHNNESQLLQCDSGYQSREIQYLDNSLLRKLCQMLDPPNHGWEQLAEILVDKSQLKFLRNKKSPTKTVLRLHKGTMEEFAGIIEISGLTDVLNLLEDYTVTNITQES